MSRKKKLTGHLFENRYVAHLIEDDRYCGTVRPLMRIWASTWRKSGSRSVPSMRQNTERSTPTGLSGRILSEYPPGTEVKPFHLPRCNRLIAGWSDEMYIIGAGRNSGTNITKQYFEKYHGGRFRSYLGK